MMLWASECSLWAEPRSGSEVRQCLVTSPSGFSGFGLCLNSLPPPGQLGCPSPTQYALLTVKQGEPIRNPGSLEGQ